MRYKIFRDTHYVVYDNGEVWTMKFGWRRVSEHDVNGYRQVKLSIGEKGSRYSKGFFVHRMVAECFIENPEGKPQVNHKNGIKSDNRVENLEWCTRRENMNHAIATGLIGINVDNWVVKDGRRSPKEYIKTFTNEDAEVLRVRLINGEDIRDLAKEYGVSVGLIYSASHGRNGYKVLGETPSEYKKRINREKREERARGILERRIAKESRRRIEFGIGVKANWDEVSEYTFWGD